METTAQSGLISWRGGRNLSLLGCQPAHGRESTVLQACYCGRQRTFVENSSRGSLQAIVATPYRNRVGGWTALSNAGQGGPLRSVTEPAPAVVLNFQTTIKNDASVKQTRLLYFF